VALIRDAGYEIMKVLTVIMSSCPKDSFGELVGADIQHARFLSLFRDLPACPEESKGVFRET
jgi:hypothetical protein